MSQEGSGFQEPRGKLGGGRGAHKADRNGKLFAAFPDSFPSSALLFGTELLSGIWKLVTTPKI